MGIGWTPAPPEDSARLGDEGWPLTDYLLFPPDAAPCGASAADGAQAARIAAHQQALRALIHAAFDP